MNRRDFQELSNVRLKEARALLAGGHWDGAYYLAGYAVECALKACIAKGTDRYAFPDKDKVFKSYTHNFGTLVGVAEIQRALGAKISQDPTFRRNWEITLEWSEESRYKRHTATDAQDLVKAIADRQPGSYYG